MASAPTVEGTGEDDDGVKFRILLAVDELTQLECWHGYIREAGKEEREVLLPDLKIPFEQEPEYPRAADSG